MRIGFTPSKADSIAFGTTPVIRKNANQPLAVRFGSDTYSSRTKALIGILAEYGLKPASGTTSQRIANVVGDLAVMDDALTGHADFLLTEEFRPMSLLIHLFGQSEVGQEGDDPEESVRQILEDDLGLEMLDEDRGISGYLANLFFIKYGMGLDSEKLSGMTYEGKEILSRELQKITKGGYTAPSKMPVESIAWINDTSKKDVQDYLLEEFGVPVKGDVVGQALADAYLLREVFGVDEYSLDGIYSKSPDSEFPEKYSGLITRMLEARAARNEKATGDFRQAFTPLDFNKKADEIKVKPEELARRFVETYGVAPRNRVAAILLVPVLDEIKNEREAAEAEQRALEEAEIQAEVHRRELEQRVRADRAAAQAALDTKKGNLRSIKGEIQDIAIRLAGIQAQMSGQSTFYSEEDSRLARHVSELMDEKNRYNPPPLPDRTALDEKLAENSAINSDLGQINRELREINSRLTELRANPPHDADCNRLAEDADSLIDTNMDRSVEYAGTCQGIAGQLNALVLRYEAIEKETAFKRGPFAQAEPSILREPIRLPEDEQQQEQEPPTAHYPASTGDNPSSISLMEPGDVDVEDAPALTGAFPRPRRRRTAIAAGLLAVVAAVGVGSQTPPGQRLGAQMGLFGDTAKPGESGDMQALDTEKVSKDSIAYLNKTLLPEVNAFYAPRLAGFPLTETEIAQVWEDAASTNLDFATLLAFEYSLHGADPYNKLAVEYEVANSTDEEKELAANGVFDPLFEKARERFIAKFEEAGGDDVKALELFFDEGAVQQQGKDISAEKQAFVNYYVAHKKEISDHLLALTKDLKLKPTIMPAANIISLQAGMIDGIESTFPATPQNFTRFNMTELLPNLVDGSTFTNEVLTDKELQNPSFLAAFAAAHLMLDKSEKPEPPVLRNSVHELQDILNSLAPEERTILRALQVYEGKHKDVLNGEGQFSGLTQKLLAGLNGQFDGKLNLNAKLA